MSDQKFYWAAQPTYDNNQLKVTLYREVTKYDQREGSYTTGEKIAESTFAPGDHVEADISQWAHAQKQKWLTQNATGLVAGKLKGKHYL